MTLAKLVVITGGVLLVLAWIAAQNTPREPLSLGEPLSLEKNWKTIAPQGYCDHGWTMVMVYESLRWMCVDHLTELHYE